MSLSKGFVATDDRAFARGFTRASGASPATWSPQLVSFTAADGDFVRRNAALTNHDSAPWEVFSALIHIGSVGASTATRNFLHVYTVGAPVPGTVLSFTRTSNAQGNKAQVLATDIEIGAGNVIFALNSPVGFLASGTNVTLLFSGSHAQNIVRLWKHEAGVWTDGGTVTWDSGPGEDVGIAADWADLVTIGANNIGGSNADCSLGRIVLWEHYFDISQLSVRQQFVGANGYLIETLPSPTPAIHFGGNQTADELDGNTSQGWNDGYNQGDCGNFDQVAGTW